VFTIPRPKHKSKKEGIYTMVCKKRFGWFGATVLACIMNVALASGGEEPRLEHAPIDRTDMASIQRGARLFTNYCLSCHSARYMRYSALRDLNLDDKQIHDQLQVTGDKVTDFMKVAIEEKDAKNWLGTVPPDLTLVARARHADWLYGYLRGFYRDSARPTGWNNLVFPNVGMPHVLWERSGQASLGVQLFDSLDEARGESLRKEGPSKIVKEHGHGGDHDQYALKYLSYPQPNPKTAEEYNRNAADLVNFLVFMGEPGYLGHRQIGRYVLIALVFSVLVAYIVKREYWRDIR
jgi:ubiquinol-cytochrome c reductase cytochrome c1 subunit